MGLVHFTAFFLFILWLYFLLEWGILKPVKVMRLLIVSTILLVVGITFFVFLMFAAMIVTERPSSAKTSDDDLGVGFWIALFISLVSSVFGCVGIADSLIKIGKLRR